MPQSVFTTVHRFSPFSSAISRQASCASFLLSTCIIDRIVLCLSRCVLFNAGTLALVLYTLITRQVGVSSGAQAAQKLATTTASLRGISTGLRPALQHRTSAAAAAMSTENLRPVEKVVQGQKVMEGRLPTSPSVVQYATPLRHFLHDLDPAIVQERDFCMRHTHTHTCTYVTW